MIKLIPGDRVSVDAGLGITKTGNVQRITESTVFVKHYNGAVVGYRTQHVTKMISEQAAVKPRGVGLKSEFDAFKQVMEKTLTPAELKKREEVAKAIERENPGMDMSKKMAIATATAKKVAEETVEEAKAHTVPKTAKEKSLAALAHPKDKITHADVMVGRGIKREGAMDMLKRVGSKVLDTLGHGDDEQMRKDLQKKMGIPQTGKPGMATQKEDVDRIDEISTKLLAKAAHSASDPMKHYDDDEKYHDPQKFADYAAKKKDAKSAAAVQGAADAKGHYPRPNQSKGYDKLSSRAPARVTAAGKANKQDVKTLKSKMKEDTHYCAKHVFSERFGEGMVVEGQHAEPNEQGLIEWYDVDFGGTVRRVMTEKVKVMHAEYHMNHKKKMKEEDEIEVEDEDEEDKEEMKEMSSKEKMKRGLYNKEETEQIDELNKDTLTSYQDKADADIMRKHRVLGPQIKAGDAKAANKTAGTIQKRMAGIDKAVERLNKEEVVSEAMISYSDFQSKIASHQKAGNQIKDDKYDKKKASYTVIDKEGTAKKITHTDSGVSQQHLGSVKRDDDESSETTSTEKRGRGRPAGSKSGARN